MLSLIGFIIVLGVIVFIHEFGHYYAAIRCGVKVETFSIGFGKKLWSRIDSKGTEWQVCAVPFGGFIKMEGDRSSNVSSRHPSSFQKQNLAKRLIIVAAGPLANFLLAITILAGFYYQNGVKAEPAIISEVIAESPAGAAKLQMGDKILKVDGIDISNFSEFRQIIASHPDQSLTLLLQRGEDIVSLKITPQLSKEQTGFIGVKASTIATRTELGILASISLATHDVLRTSHIILKALGQIVTGTRSMDQIGGALSIAKESGKSMEEGSASLLLFIAFISINIGLMNLIPLPLLDGGYILLMLFEAAIARRISEKVERIYYKLGLGSLIFLVVISTSNDIKSLLL
ncbi:MAG: RIP metalloprotease RseP [Pseudomonadota bacterium]